MARLYNTIRVSAAPDKAWAAVGDLAGVIKWIPGVTSCRVEGTRRICNGGQIQEEITDYSAGRRSYRYTHVQVPLPVKSSHGTFTVEPDGAGSLVVMDAEVEPLDPAKEGELVPMIDGFYKQALESLRQFIEASVREDARR